jgi:hypothetical protein
VEPVANHEVNTPTRTGNGPPTSTGLTGDGARVGMRLLRKQNNSFQWFDVGCCCFLFQLVDLEWVRCWTWHSFGTCGLD